MEGGREEGRETKTSHNRHPSLVYHSVYLLMSTELLWTVLLPVLPLPVWYQDPEMYWNERMELEMENRAAK